MSQVELSELQEENQLLIEQILILQEKMISMRGGFINNSKGECASNVKDGVESREVRGLERSESVGDVSFSNANYLLLNNRLLEAETAYRELLITKPELSFVISSFIERCQELRADSGGESAISKNMKIRGVYSDANSAGWSAVITVYKRQDYLGEQLRAIQDQSVPPDQIVVLQNESHVEIDPFLLDKYEVKVIQSDINSLYFRWIVGYLLDSCYICVFDDDVIPGHRWIESCIYACEKFNALVGPSGRRAAPYQEGKAWTSVENFSESTFEFCDWVCNSYFFRKEWVKYITQFSRYYNTQKTFDDIQLATTLKAAGNINVIVPPQVDKKSEWNGHVKREYGHDEHALWKRHASDHADQRRDLIQKLDKSGFQWVS